MNVLPPELAPLAGATLVICSFLTSALTAALGLGGGILLLAVMAAVVPVSAVIPVHGVVQLGSNGGRALLMARHARRNIVGPFLLGSVAGAVVGGSAAINLPENLLRVSLGLFVLALTWLPRPKTRGLGAGGIAVVGSVTTFLTMFFGATGPLIAAFLSPDRLDRHTLVSTHAACMTIQHVLKVAAFGILGFAFSTWIPLLVMMIASGFIGTLAGAKLLDKLPAKVFRWALKILLTVLALHLCVVGAAGLTA